jgi:hypothetical protein
MLVNSNRDPIPIPMANASPNSAYAYPLIKSRQSPRNSAVHVGRYVSVTQPFHVYLRHANVPSTMLCSRGSLALERSAHSSTPFPPGLFRWRLALTFAPTEAAR